MLDNIISITGYSKTISWSRTFWILTTNILLGYLLLLISWPRTNMRIIYVCPLQKLLTGHSVRDIDFIDPRSWHYSRRSFSSSRV